MVSHKLKSQFKCFCFEKKHLLCIDVFKALSSRRVIRNKASMFLLVALRVIKPRLSRITDGNE